MFIKGGEKYWCGTPLLRCSIGIYRHQQNSVIFETYNFHNTLCILGVSLYSQSIIAYNKKRLECENKIGQITYD